MPRKYSRKRDKSRSFYSSELINQAVENVKRGNSIRSVANEFQLVFVYYYLARTYDVFVFRIPFTTLQNRIRGQHNKILGGQKVFSNDQENLIKRRIFQLTNNGFPLTVDELRISTYKFANRLHKMKKIQRVPSNWTENGKASTDWYAGFRERHPDISLRLPQGLSNSRAQAFNLNRVDSYFVQLKEKMEMNELENYPQLIYNADETGLSNVPKTCTKVLAQKGQRNVQKIQSSERGTLTTLIVCVNSTGDTIPPFLIFKKKNPSTENFPKGSKLRSSDSGWINDEIFVEFLSHFQQHRKKISDKRAVLIVDGHKTHVGFSALDFCQKNEIDLLCIPPHTSHRLQPLDTHFFKTLKTKWSKHCSLFLKDNAYAILTKDEFHLPFTRVWNEMIMERGLIVNGFQHCGIYPTENTVKPHEFLASNSFYAEEIHESTIEHALASSMPLKKKSSKTCHSLPFNIQPKIKTPQKQKKAAQNDQKQSMTKPSNSGFIRYILNFKHYF